MSIKSVQAAAGLFVCRDGTGALATPSVGPAGVLYVNGVANGAAVTISGANPYKWAVTLPALAAGDVVQIYVTATISGVATAEVVWTEAADTKRVSDLNDLAAGAAMSLTVGAVTAGVIATGAIDADSLAADALAAIDTELSAAHGAGAWDTGAGTGAITYDYTVLNSITGLPVPGVQVWVSTDLAGANVVAGTVVTNAFGVARFYLDAGNYYFWKQLAGYSDDDNPDLEVVA